MLNKLLLFFLPGVAIGRLVAAGGTEPLRDLPVLAAAGLLGAALTRLFRRSGHLHHLGLLAFIPAALPDHWPLLALGVAGLVLGLAAAIPEQRFFRGERRSFFAGVALAVLVAVYGGRAVSASVIYTVIGALSALPAAMYFFFHSFPAPKRLRMILTVLLAAITGAAAPVTLLLLKKYAIYPVTTSDGRGFLAFRSAAGDRFDILLLAPDGAVRRDLSAGYRRQLAAALPALLQPEHCDRILFLAESPSVIPAIFADFERVNRIDTLVAGPPLERLFSRRSEKIRRLTWRPYQLRLPADRYDLIFVAELPPASDRAVERYAGYLAGRLAPGGAVVLPDGPWQCAALPEKAHLPVGAFQVRAARGTGLPGDDYARLEERLKLLATPDREILPEGTFSDVFRWEAELDAAAPALLADRRAGRISLAGYPRPDVSPWLLATVLLGGYLLLRFHFSRHEASDRNFALLENGGAAALLAAGAAALLSDFALTSGNHGDLLTGLAAASLPLLADPAGRQRANTMILLFGLGGLLLFGLFRVEAAVIAGPPLLLLALAGAARSGRGDATGGGVFFALVGLAAGGFCYLLALLYAGDPALAALTGGAVLLLPRCFKI